VPPPRGSAKKDTYLGGMKGRLRLGREARPWTNKRDLKNGITGGIGYQGRPRSIYAPIIPALLEKTLYSGRRADGRRTLKSEAKMGKEQKPRTPRYAKVEMQQGGGSS